MRLTGEELNQIMKENEVDRLYSWSKINCFMTSPYEYFLKYVLHKKEDVDNCAYAPMGGICHSILESLYEGKIKYDDMSENFDDGWTTAIEIADLKFDRNDESKNDSIKEKYRENLKHFFANHKMIENKIKIEQFMTAKIGDYLLQGYIDAIFKDNDGNYNIIDWKTSSKYSGKAAEEKCGQLVVYAIGLHQQGIPIENIKIAWNFLKYCTVTITQKNGKTKDRIIERCKIGESLQTNAKMWLKDGGYDIDEYLKLLIDTNSISCLPEDIQEKYEVSDCYVYVPLTIKLLDKWIDTIVSTIKDIELRESDYEESHNEKLFWDSAESVQKESYYFSTLCGFSAALHKPYREHLERLEAQQKGEDMFNGLGSDEVSVSKTEPKNNDELDLSWLNDV